MTLTLLYLLEKNDLDHQIFENVKALNSCVMTMWWGEKTDASIIFAISSTTIKEKNHDLEIP